ncbi:MAG: TVP38/TMEM64 family protein [Candidatus Saccharimonadales bacterium]
MSIFKKRLSKKTKIQLAAVAVVVVLIIAYIAWDIIYGGPISYILTNKDEVVAFVESRGFLGPLAFVILQTLQTVIAPIPGNVTGAVGGFLFGWWGILWTMIGSAIGFYVIFLIARKFGRRLVEKIIKKESLDKFDYLANQTGSLVFFLVFLIPGLPDDIIGYIAGLTSIPIKQLMVMVIIGRIPATVATNMLGAGIGEADIRPVLVLAVLSAIVLIALFMKRKAIMDWMNSLGKNNKKGKKDK